MNGGFCKRLIWPSESPKCVCVCVCFSAKPSRPLEKRAAQCASVGAVGHSAKPIHFYAAVNSSAHPVVPSESASQRLCRNSPLITSIRPIRSTDPGKSVTIFIKAFSKFSSFLQERPMETPEVGSRGRNTGAAKLVSKAPCPFPCGGEPSNTSCEKNRKRDRCTTASADSAQMNTAPNRPCGAGRPRRWDPRL